MDYGSEHRGLDWYRHGDRSRHNILDTMRKRGKQFYLQAKARVRIF
jgi:hypothetical protein